MASTGLSWRHGLYMSECQTGTAFREAQNKDQEIKDLKPKSELLLGSGNRAELGYCPVTRNRTRRI